MFAEKAECVVEILDSLKAMVEESKAIERTKQEIFNLMLEVAKEDGSSATEDMKTLKEAFNKAYFIAENLNRTLETWFYLIILRNINEN